MDVIIKMILLLLGIALLVWGTGELIGGNIFGGILIILFGLLAFSNLSNEK